MGPEMILFLIVVIAVFVVAFVVVIAGNVKKNDDKLNKNGFSITRSAGALRVDDKHKKWCVNDGLGEVKIYNFSDVVDCKIDENSVLNKVNKIGVYVYTLNEGAVYISVYNGETKRDSSLYKFNRDEAQQICSLLNSIKVQRDVTPLNIKQTSDTKNSSADNIEEQLKKFKSMVESGLITQEDYEAKKKQLLGI